MDEKELLLEYEVKRVTEFGQYTAVVTVDKTVDKGTRMTHIALYQGEPVIHELWGLLKIQLDPIRETNINPATNVNQEIKRLIVDWEIPFYQQQKAEEFDCYLEINHEEELKKKRARLHMEEEQEKYAMLYHDGMNDEMHVIGDAKKIHPNSLANLKQYQDRKKAK